ncbi:MAG: Preprotein translocase subunit SecD [Candidatus Gottesmanbacteria bacterium GW2011_GWA1_43_11]|uniref:Protein translocase subunit SecD n=2 Tax=Microgenomates group TaxID=1794810 RepID=A0A1F5I0Q2_9BACT|nr:MAG: Preprotein translocase subunit SecD [Candidatus Gottesmanbacteria bacterium GW2011_GWA1_43_11]OGE09956.1 MAG: protein-export membrane protein SecD [Candidatus Curtissbacteria bacterium RIFCSPLOWO2_01_FULL_42_26]
MLKNPRATFALIILLTVLALFIDIPNLKIFGRQISHPKIETKVLKRDLEPKLGLDLAGGVQLVLSADMTNIDSSDRNNALDSAQNVIENRINSLGVSESIVQTAKTAGDYRLIVEMPGISDIDQAVATVKKTAHLEFRVLADDAPPEATLSALPEHFVATPLTGKDLKRASASPGQDPQSPGYVVNLEFNSDGAKKLEEITRDHLNAPMAMFLDDEPISWPPPVIRAVIADGNAQISGQFDAKSAKQLAIQLNAGALPVPLSIESQTRVGPSLGREAIAKSIFATAVGLTSVAFFMIAYYQFLGVFAIGALLIYTTLVFAVFKIIPVTLTLAGITGFVLSIGMAVDANILIFERIKEEIAWGKPKLEAFYAGFDRAWTSIRDSNVSSLITTAILFNFGTGPIRGFALTLAIGILISMFSAITVTRTLLRVFWIRKI